MLRVRLIEPEGGVSVAGCNRQSSRWASATLSSPSRSPATAREACTGYVPATTTLTSQEAWILGLCVARDHRRRGLGRDLMAEFITRLRGNGTARVRLTVESANRPAIFSGVGAAGARDRAGATQPAGRRRHRMRGPVRQFCGGPSGARS